MVHVLALLLEAFKAYNTAKGLTNSHSKTAILDYFENIEKLILNVSAKRFRSSFGLAIPSLNTVSVQLESLARVT